MASKNETAPSAARKEKRDTGASIEHKLSKIISDQDIAQLKEIVSSAIERDRELLVHGLVTRLKPWLALGAKASTNGQAANGSAAEWLAIDSLSKLRAEVGGRFQNLKERWIESGFPLKEHRGEKVQKVEINHTGWLELSNWISGQGFDVRLCTDRPGVLFEIRKR